MKRRCVIYLGLLALWVGLASGATAQEPLKVFILAGDNYLLNGQEYLQLVSGVRDALNDLGHACPQYADRKAELAGLIWFQGEKDGQSDAKSAVYEEHLAALIRDLRKDFKQPNLPVVVAAMADAKRDMPPNEQRVFAAQMAVGDAEKYPEFAGNVISIDTRPMCRPNGECPGGRDRYNGNAASYLEIGDAMAEAMLNLLSARTNGED